MSYFNYCTGLTMTNKKFDALFGGPARQSESDITQRDMDLAASIQQVTEEIVVKLAKGIQQETGTKNLCLAEGGFRVRSVRARIVDKDFPAASVSSSGPGWGLLYFWTTQTDKHWN